MKKKNLIGNPFSSIILRDNSQRKKYTFMPIWWVLTNKGRRQKHSKVSSLRQANETQRTKKFDDRFKQDLTKMYKWMERRNSIQSSQSSQTKLKHWKSFKTFLVPNSALSVKSPVLNLIPDQRCLLLEVWSCSLLSHFKSLPHRNQTHVFVQSL